MRVALGLLVGVGLAVVVLVGLLVAGVVLLPVLPWPRARRGLLGRGRAAVRALSGLERRRLAAYFGEETSGDHGDLRALRYLAARVPLGGLAALVLASGAIGAAYGSLLVWSWFLYRGEHSLVLVLSGAGGLFLLFLSVHGAFAVVALERRLARRHLGPSPRELLQRRIDELSASRAGVVRAVDDERRRIERDLHDGVQQHLVALGMLLGRARRSADEARCRELLAQAHEESRRALEELREVAWRVYPSALDEAGLHAALETVAERSGLPVRVEYRLARPPGPTVAAAAYFVVCEAVTNAAKHAAADRVEVRLTERAGPGEGIVVRISDDGCGGADPAGGGLVGLARRVAAVDGALRVDSPPGGPTVITAELPCG
ncbi:sensor histidine kinase [Streptomyces capparidis]